MGEADEIEDGLKPAPSGDEEAASEKDTPKSMSEVFRELDDFAKGEKVEDGEIDQPEDTDSEGATEGVERPGEGEGEEKWEKEPRAKFFEVELWTRLDEKNEAEEIKKDKPDEGE